MKQTSQFTVGCATCNMVKGTVSEVEAEDRPGFFRNVSVPDPMPTKCDVCGAMLSRL